MTTIETPEQIAVLNEALTAMKILRGQVLQVKRDYDSCTYLLDSDKETAQQVKALEAKLQHASTVVNVTAEAADIYVSPTYDNHFKRATTRHLAFDRWAMTALCGRAVEPGQYGLSPLWLREVSLLCKRCRKQLTIEQGTALDTAVERSGYGYRDDYDRSKYDTHVRFNGEVY